VSASGTKYLLEIVTGGPEGSRHVLGLLLMTFGLVEAALRAHPREWVIFLNRDQYEPAIVHQTRAFLEHARYIEHCIGDEPCVSGEIPALPDVRAGGQTMAECQQNLAETRRNRLLLRLARREGLSATD
jgi:hypothetical protein